MPPLSHIRPRPTRAHIATARRLGHDPSMARLPIFPALFCGVLLAAPGARAFDRLGFSLDFLGEYGLQDGEQRINQTRLDESFDWQRAGLSATAWALQPWQGRFSWGPGVRLHGR